MHLKTILLLNVVLYRWLKQFSDYNIQFVSDCGTFDYYWLLQLIGEWEESKMICPSCKSSEAVGEYSGFSNYCIDCETLATTNKIGLPKLPPNISPVPQDLNDLILYKYLQLVNKSSTIIDAFNCNRETLLYIIDERKQNNNMYEVVDNTYKLKSNKHNSLWDAKVIKEIFNNLNKTL